MNNDSKGIYIVEPPPCLFGKIMRRIDSQRRASTVRRAVLLFLVWMASVAAFMPSFNALRSGLSESGFREFFSLFFSDFGMAVSYWHSWALALLESLPIASIIVFLVVIFVFLKSLKSMADDIKIILTPAVINK